MANYSSEIGEREAALLIAIVREPVCYVVQTVQKSAEIAAGAPCVGLYTAI